VILCFARSPDEKYPYRIQRLQPSFVGLGVLYRLSDFMVRLGTVRL